MLKDATYKEKLNLLQEWFPYIIQTVKTELKNDHLKQDWQFSKAYFPNKNINKVTQEELTEGYLKALQQEEKADDIAEFIFNRWLLKNTDIYQYFEETLSKISPNFTELSEIDQTKSQTIVDQSIKQFGPLKTYLFAVINSVVFPQSVYDALRQKAKQHLNEKETQEHSQKEEKNVEAIRKNHQQEIARLTDKYEKKLQGLQKKYINDTENLKKQIASLQRKIHE